MIGKHRPPRAPPGTFIDLRRLFEVVPPDFYGRDTEEAYRRGYWHGYSQALDDVREHGPASVGKSAWWQRLAKFFDGPLCRWRCKEHNGEFEIPPSYPGR